MPKSIQIPPGTASDGLEITDDEFRIVKSMHPGWVIIPGVPLLALSFGFALALWVAVQQRDLVGAVFLLPVLIFWCLFASIARDVLFGRREYRLAADGVVLSWKTLGASQTRSIPLEELIDFRGPEPSADDDVPRTGIEAVALGQNLWFDPQVDGVDDRLLVKRLNGRLAELRRRHSVPAPPPGNLADCRECRLPVDSSWRAVPQTEGIVLEAYGTWPPASRKRLLLLNVGGASALSLFLVASAVALSLRAPDAAPPTWQLLLTVSPVAGIGLGLIAFLLTQAVAPLRVVRWRFTERGADYEDRLFGLRRARPFLHPLARRLTVIDNTPSEWSRVREGLQGNAAPPRNAFGLIATDLDGSHAWAIRGLTLGEAMWIKGRIQSALPSVQTEDDGPSTERDRDAAAPIPGRVIRRPLCVECLEPIGKRTPADTRGSICPECGTLQPTTGPLGATNQPEDDEEVPLSTISPEPAEVPEEIRVERSDADGLRLSFPAVPPGPLRRYGPYKIGLWSLVGLAWFLWMSHRRWLAIPDGGMLSISAVLGSVVAVLALGQAVTLAALIRWSRVTIDLNRERILVRWGWSIIAKQWEDALSEIEGFRIERLTIRENSANGTRTIQRPTGTVIVAGRSVPLTPTSRLSLFACYRNRTFIRAVIGLVRSKLKELRSHDRASTP